MKSFIKNAIKIIALCMTLPFASLAILQKKITAGSSIFIFFAEIFSLLPGTLGSYIRAAYYHLTLKRFGLSSYILFGSLITKMESSIGDHCGIGSYASIGFADIGDHVAIANYSSVISGGAQHDFSDPNKGPLEADGVYKCIKIGSKSFIGERSVVMSNIGQSSIVAAGSVVARDVPDLVVVAGNPARIVKSRQ